MVDSESGWTIWNDKAAWRQGEILSQMPSIHWVSPYSRKVER